jgi:hypothetical protein
VVLILCRPLDVIDNDGVDGAFGSHELEAELFFERGEE